MQEKESNHGMETGERSCKQQVLSHQNQLLNTELIRAVLCIGNVWQKKIKSVHGAGMGESHMTVSLVNTCNWIAMW